MLGLLAGQRQSDRAGTYEFYWQPPPPVYDPARPREMLKEAGFPNGFDGGEYYCNSSYATIGEMVVDNLLRGRHPHPAAADRARRLYQGVQREEIQEH